MALNLIDTDEVFFAQHRDRQFHVRDAIGNESNAEFMSLGPHERSRRKILVWKIPKNNRMAPGKFMKVPMLAFSDETIEDTDDVVGPILHGIIGDAAKRYGMKPPG